MIVSKKHQALVLKVKDPNRITSVIPGAKLLRHKGNTYVVVRHRLDEVKVLNNIGIQAPSPISHYYDWPGRYKPFGAQQEAAAFMTLHPRAFNLSDMGCVDSETEYLSPTGWIKISEYTGGQVAQYRPSTGKAEFVEPTEYVKLPCPMMIKIKTKYGIDQLLSPEHRVLLTAGARTEVLHAEQLLQRHDDYVTGGNPGRQAGKISYSKACIPASFSMDNTTRMSLTDAQVKVQVAVIADGYFPYAESNYTCHVRIKKQRKKDRLIALLTAAGIEWEESKKDYPTAVGFSIFKFKAPQRLKIFDSSWWAASEAQKRIIADEVMHWDGSTPDNENRSFRFSSSIKESADFIQYVFSSIGYIARLSVSTRERRGTTETEYNVGVRRQPRRDLQVLSVSSTGNRHQTMSVEPSTDGFKYCFMVPSTFLIFRRNGCVFASGNTGKTMATLWAYDYLKSIGQVKKMLVISPLSTLERTWADEVFNQFPNLTTAVLHGSPEKRLKLLATDADIYLINHDGIKAKGFVEALAKRPDIDLIVIDEISQMIRNAGTERFTKLRDILRTDIPRKAWGLTGTPTPNSPTDAWAQCKLLVPDNVPPYFGKFKSAVMKQVTNFLWVARPEAMDIVHEAMQPSIRFTRDECVDLPECTYLTRSAELTPAQKLAYKDMMVKLKTEVDAGEVTAVNEAVKAQKLIQIACGVVYDSNGGRLDIDASPRLEIVREVCEEAGTKVIVFVPFVSVIDKVAEFLKAKGFSVAVIHGGVSKNERDKIFKAFQKEAEPKILVAQPATMSHGLTLTAASTMIWYAPVTSCDTYLQACARITRPGQKVSQLIVNIEGTPIEQKYYKRLMEKEKTQGLLLDLVKENR